MKKLFLGSVVLAALVFSGCGSSHHSKVDSNESNPTPTPTKDTTPPTVNSTVEGAGAAELSISSFATDNVGVTSIVIGGADKDKFTVSNDKITIPATPATYNITITAKDAAGNETTQAVVVTVKAGSPNPNSSTITLSDGTEWSKLDSNGSKSFVLFSNAEGLCPNGMELPTYDDMNKSFNVANSKILDLLKDVNFTGTTNDSGKNNFGYYIFWTNTSNAAGTHQAFLINDNGSVYEDATINKDDSDHAFVTCVKK